MTDQPKKPYSPRMDPKNAVFLPIEDKAKHDAELAKVLAAEPRTAGGVLPFDFDRDQDRWPAGAPDGLGGQWRDTSPSGLSVSALIDKIWQNRHAPYGRTLLSGKDDNGTKHHLEASGRGSITAYNEHWDSTTFHDKEELKDWFSVHVDQGGGDGITWDTVATDKPKAAPDIMKWLEPESWDPAEAYDYIDQNSYSFKNGDITVATGDGQALVVFAKDMALSIWKWDPKTETYVRSLNDASEDDMAKISDKWYQVNENTPTVTKLSDFAKKPKYVKVSSAPDTSSSPELKASLEQLTKLVNSDPLNTDNISSGQVGIVSKITTSDGTYIRKENKQWGTYSGKDLADAEELVSELGLRIGARVPAVERVNKNTVHIGFIEGQTAAEHDAEGHDVKGVPDQRSSRMLGLLDLMTLNGDRHEGNWIVNEHDDPPIAYGIDHGLAWAPLPLTREPSDAELEVHISNLGSPFIPNFVPYDELFSKRDLQRARSALEAMEPRFIEMKKQRWLDASRQILDMIEKQMDFTLGQQA